MAKNKERLELEIWGSIQHILSDNNIENISVNALPDLILILREGTVIGSFRPELYESYGIDVESIIRAEIAVRLAIKAAPEPVVGMLPLRGAHRLASLIIPRKYRDILLGDLDELFPEIIKRCGTRDATVWFYGQVIRAAATLRVRSVVTGIGSLARRRPRD